MPPTLPGIRHRRRPAPGSLSHPVAGPAAGGLASLDRRAEHHGRRADGRPAGKHRGPQRRRVPGGARRAMYRAAAVWVFFLVAWPLLGLAIGGIGASITASQPPLTPPREPRPGGSRSGGVFVRKARPPASGRNPEQAIRLPWRPDHRRHGHGHRGYRKPSWRRVLRRSTMTASCCRSRQRPSIPASPLACVNRDWVHSSASLLGGAAFGSVRLSAALT
jgi:hypothetical protein